MIHTRIESATLPLEHIHIYIYIPHAFALNRINSASVIQMINKAFACMYTCKLQLWMHAVVSRKHACTHIRISALHHSSSKTTHLLLHTCIHKYIHTRLFFTQQQLEDKTNTHTRTYIHTYMSALHHSSRNNALTHAHLHAHIHIHTYVFLFYMGAVQRKDFARNSWLGLNSRNTIFFAVGATKRNKAQQSATYPLNHCTFVWAYMKKQFLDETGVPPENGAEYMVKEVLQESLHACEANELCEEYLNRCACVYTCALWDSCFANKISAWRVFEKEVMYVCVCPICVHVFFGARVCARMMSEVYLHRFLMCECECMCNFYI